MKSYLIEIAIWNGQTWNHQVTAYNKEEATKLANEIMEKDFNILEEPRIKSIEEL